MLGCSSLGYLAHTANGHFKVMSKRQSIEQVLKQEDTNTSLRRDLNTVQNIRAYASNELALPDNKSYTQYVELERDFVTWVVFAAPELSLRAINWCFWIVGCVPYRGYFDPNMAEKFADSLRTQNLEVHIAPVAAYSTLGWFSDPVLSSMLNKGVIVTADYIIHELAHQKVYIKDDTEFNEAFATAVATAGVQKWLFQANDMPSLLKYQNQLNKKKQIYALVKKLRQRLENVYDSSLADNLKRKHKQLAFEEYQADTTALLNTWQQGELYQRWAVEGMNNAKLNAMAAYYELVPDFLNLLKDCEQKFARFYEVVSSMQILTREQRRKSLRQAKCMPIDVKTDAEHI